MISKAVHLLRRIGLYEAIAFITGFILMAYELAASRILAPTIGTSIYVWTSVIGVMIAALAFGYAAGGWAADRRGRKQDIIILLIGAAMGIALTCLLADAALATITMTMKDPRLQGVVAAAVLFAPASFALGMISPYLAKLRIRSLDTTGRSVAGLSALNSIGGITGTFLTGFVFFNYIGSRETLILLAILLLACSWMVMARHHVRDRAIVCLVACGVLAAQMTIPAQANVIADIDTPTSHYKIMNTLHDGRALRILTMGPGGYQSGVYTTGKKDLAFAYTRKLAEVVHTAPQHNRILILGGGAFTLPEYLSRQYPSAHIDVVEIDPQLPAIAQQYFRYESQSNVTVIHQDARTFLRTTTARYDVALIDVYNDTSVPFSLTTREYADSLKNVMQPQGIVAANMIGAVSGSCLPLIASLNQTYLHAFPHGVMYHLGLFGSNLKANMVGVYSGASLGWTNQISGQQLNIAPASQSLTDDFAPVEKLIQQCEHA
jgi:predicted membrane-bound spermidine synthase